MPTFPTILSYRELAQATCELSRIASQLSDLADLIDTHTDNLADHADIPVELRHPFFTEGSI